MVKPENKCNLPIANKVLKHYNSVLPICRLLCATYFSFIISSFEKLQDAKKDEAVRKAYKSLAALHEVSFSFLAFEASTKDLLDL